MLHHKSTQGQKHRGFYLIFFFLFTGIYGHVYGQMPVPADTMKVDTPVIKRADDVSGQYDVVNLYQDVFNRKPAPSNKKPSGIIIIPNIASNPTIGSQIGIKAVAGRKLGNDPNTLLSVAATSASITTKGIIYFYISHNVYTAGNRWNFQGSLVAAKTVTPDFGLGIGKASEGSEEDKKTAIEMVHNLGADAIYEKMKFQMRASGIKSIPRGLRQSTMSNPANLTQRELDVLQLFRCHYLQNKKRVWNVP